MTLLVGVIGPAGFGGSYLCAELLNRGHSVRGLSRQPEKLGSHPNYTPHSVDIEKSSFDELIEAFKGVDVLVNEYGPHTAGENALTYKPAIETNRKIIICVKEAKVGYFIQVGGCGSLHLPGQRFDTCVDSKSFWLWYRRGIADSHAHVSYMEERLGSMGTSLRNYRNARLRLRENPEDKEAQKSADDYEQAAMRRDAALDYVTASRTVYMFFEGNTSFAWSFASPPALYRSGVRTGSYEICLDSLPVKPANLGTDDNALDLDGRLQGISAADMAIAIADEAESKKLVGKHWSAYADLSDDTPVPSYITI